MSDGFTLPAASAQNPDYRAGSVGRRLRTWRVGSPGPNTVNVTSLGTIRNRARDAARNDPWAGALLDRLDSNGIGVGIQAKMVNGDADLKKQVSALWNASWSELDADGVLDFGGLQYLAWHEWAEVGEVFARLRPRRESDGLQVPLQVQLIEAEQCPADLYRQSPNGNPIRAGIEFNAIGKRLAYWMYPHHPGDGHQWNESNELRRIPAEEVIHLYRPTRAGQLRGIPDWASVMVRMFHVDSLDDAVLERQKIANLFAGFYTQTPGPEDPNSPNEGATTDTDADGTPLVGLEPGTMQELPPGMEAHFSQPPAPGNDYGDFLRGHLQAIAARVGVPYEVLTGDLRNVSDRALRLILNEFRRGLEMRQWLFFIPQFCQRIRIAWFDRAVLSSALDVADYATQRAELTQTLWVPQGWPYSHPVQDVASDVKAIRAGLQSRSSTILGRGDDPEQVDAEIAEDDKRAEGYGLVLESNAKHVSNAGVTQARPEGTTLPNGDSVANTDEE